MRRMIVRVSHRPTAIASAIASAKQAMVATSA